MPSPPNEAGSRDDAKLAQARGDAVHPVADHDLGDRGGQPVHRHRRIALARAARLLLGDRYRLVMDIADEATAVLDGTRPLALIHN